MGNIGCGTIYTYYRKLSDETKSNRIEGVKPDNFDVILDTAEFSQRSL